jgi:hypothetical protein
MIVILDIISQEMLPLTILNANLQAEADTGEKTLKIYILISYVFIAKRISGHFCAISS